VHCCALNEPVATIFIDEEIQDAVCFSIQLLRAKHANLKKNVVGYLCDNLSESEYRINSTGSNNNIPLQLHRDFHRDDDSLLILSTHKHHVKLAFGEIATCLLLQQWCLNFS
jgi:hypothetical protein